MHKVSFTGSVATGRRIGLCAMQNLKPTTLELGGKSPVIVFADSVESEEDLEKTVEWIMVRQTALLQRGGGVWGLQFLRRCILCEVEDLS